MSIDSKIAEIEAFQAASEPVHRDNPAFMRWLLHDISLFKDIYQLTSEELKTLAAGIKNIALTPGEKGEQGIQGLQGIQGIQGIAGPRGPIGPIGPSGEVSSVFAFPFIFDGGGAAISAGTECDIEVPCNCNLISASVFGDVIGDIEFDLWNDIYANFPPTIAVSIVGATPPAIVADTKSRDTGLVDWAVSLIQGSILRVHVNSCTTITRATLSLLAVRT